MTTKIIIAVFVLVASGIAHGRDCAKTKAFAPGINAIREIYPNYQKHTPYKISKRDDQWVVFGTLPKGWKGGTPEALINQSICEVIRVYHGK